MDSKRLLRHKVNNLIHSFLIMTGMIALLSLLGWSIGGIQGLKWLFFIGLFTLILTRGGESVVYGTETDSENPESQRYCREKHEC